MSAVVFLPLSQGHVAVIDFDDFERVGRVKWTAKQSRENWYAVRGVGGRKNPKRLWLHAEIMGAIGVDHRDGDGLNNRRENLRPATQQLQARAFRKKSSGKSSQFRGVTWFARDGKWQAQVYYNGKNHFVGHYNSEVDAALAYDSAALSAGFDIRACNFPP